jgi:hypothetical protein
MVARLNLAKHLHDQGGLAASRISDDLEMLVFSPCR